MSERRQSCTNAHATWLTWSVCRWHWIDMITVLLLPSVVSSRSISSSCSLSFIASIPPSMLILANPSHLVLSSSFLSLSLVLLSSSTLSTYLLPGPPLLPPLLLGRSWSIDRSISIIHFIIYVHSSLLVPGPSSSFLPSLRSIFFFLECGNPLRNAWERGWDRRARSHVQVDHWWIRPSDHTTVIDNDDANPSLDHSLPCFSSIHIHWDAWITIIHDRTMTTRLLRSPHRYWAIIVLSSPQLVSPMMMPILPPPSPSFFFPPSPSPPMH